MPELTEQDYEASRRISSFLGWVEEWVVAIGASENGKQLVRFREGIVKELIEEALPAAIFSNRFFNNPHDIQIQMTLGNQNFDAKLHYPSSVDEPIAFLEVTQAHEGVDSYYRMLALEEQRHVSLYGTVRAKGTKATGISVAVEGRAHSHSTIQQRELELISQAIDRKADKSYPEKTALIIVFQDAIAARETDDCSIFVDFIERKAVALLQFSHVALVGWGKRFYHVVETAKGAT